MKRLTQKDEQGNWSLRGVPWEYLYEGKIITKELWERLYGALWKLMEYEDTGLTPEEAEELDSFERSQVGKMLKELNEEQRKHRWIPVEERLPEESLNSVIGWDKYRERCCFVQYYAGSWHLGDESVRIIAWMPLPEPYQKERNSNE